MSAIAIGEIGTRTLASGVGVKRQLSLVRVKGENSKLDAAQLLVLDQRAVALEIAGGECKGKQQGDVIIVFVSMRVPMIGTTRVAGKIFAWDKCSCTDSYVINAFSHTRPLSLFKLSVCYCEFVLWMRLFYGPQRAGGTMPKRTQ